MFSLEVGPLDERARVEGDERLLKRALTNLVQNSIHDNPDDCSIVIEVHLLKGMCQLTVTDDGKGIPKNKRSDMMELPYAKKGKCTPGTGHGLVISMVARTVKTHHGSLPRK